jgi:DNA-binding beta-propeller fold protein YncE
VGAFTDSVSSALSYPTGIAFAADGTVYLSDLKANRVIGRRDGVNVVEIGNLDQPLGLAVHGNLLYVGSKGRKTVEVYDLATRKHAFNLEGTFQMPSSIAVAEDGTTYVADAKANAVKIFAADGSAAGDLGDGLKFPAAVAVDATRVVVGDQGNHRVVVFPRDGGDARAYGEEVPAEAKSVNDFEARFTRVQAVALHGSDIYVLDSYHSHVQILDADGNSKGFLGSAGSCENCMRLALGLAVDPATSSVVVTDPENKRWVTLAAVEAR